MDNKLTAEEFKNIFVEHATVEWLKLSGLDPSDPKTSAIELDESEETSQLFAWRLTAEEAYHFFMDTLRKVTDAGYQIADPEDSENEQPKNLIKEFYEDALGGGEKNTSSLLGRRFSEGAVTKSSSIFVFLETAPGVAKYVKDVREWLVEVDSLGVSDDTEIEGELFFCYDTSIVTSERMECLFCEDREDIFLTVHDCKSEEENK